MAKKKMSMPALWLVLVLAALLPSACGIQQDPRQDYLDTLSTEFDALVGFLAEFEPGIETREVEFEGPNGRIARGDRTVSKSKDIADTLQALHQHMTQVPMSVLQEGMPGFDEWSSQATGIIEAGRKRAEPELARIVKDYAADPDRYAGNMELGPEGMLFISSSQISMLGGLSTSEPEGFGIDPMFLWTMDLDAWVASIREQAQRFSLEDSLD